MSQQSYVVLARKWRPAQFSDIVGQTHVVKTLMNAIRTERIHQAYLFTGSRGVGKTSIARIFSKAVRCEHSSEQGEWLNSCDQCSSCKEIATGRSVDVIEIDGASNNGVDAVREIRENAKYLPAHGTRKIYIIDEVHMLTTAAFNALLKTLEEPPEHVIFIFATTEPHKIPATILSRCQRFDFKRSSSQQLKELLNDILQKEEIDAEESATSLIAKAADGSNRDALSLLDQVISFSGKKITSQSVRESIGIIENQIILEVLKGICSRNVALAISTTDDAYQKGYDLRILTESLMEMLHAGILEKVNAPSSSVIDLYEEERQELKAIMEHRSIEELELIFQVLHYGMDGIARSPQPKVLLDILLIKCATAEILVSPFQQSSPALKKKVTTEVTSPQVIARPTPTPVISPAPPVVSPTPVSSPEKDRSVEGFLAAAKQSRPLLGSLLEHAIDLQLQENQLKITYRQEASYKAEQIQAKTYQAQVNQLVRSYFGNSVSYKIEIIQDEGGESIAERKARERAESDAKAKSEAENHPIIQEAKSLFGAQLGPIELKEDNGTEH